MSAIGQAGRRGIKRDIEIGFSQNTELSQVDKKRMKKSGSTKGTFGGLPEELLLVIFKLLSPRDQEAATCVCKSWRKIGEDKKLKMVREFCFGKRDWENYFGKIGLEPSLPPSIGALLDSPCPIWKEKKIKDTHILTLIPSVFNGEPFSLKTFFKKAKAPIKGYKLAYVFHDDKKAKKKLEGESFPNTKWIMMTRGLIPKTIYNGIAKHQKFLDLLSKNNQFSYRTPTPLEAVVSVLTDHARTGDFLFNDSSCPSYIQCQSSKAGDIKESATVGAFGHWGGVDIYHYSSEYRRMGVYGSSGIMAINEKGRDQK
ncbi:F-box protein [Candidatus Neptunochlamydia vexilliferae]|nr:F-box protein [Candidatus Neptunochlamydia vexilliferae]